MSESSKKVNMPDKLVEVMVDSVFRKNGIKPEEVKNNLSEKQREMLKEMVADLKQQVEEFQQKRNESKTEE
ncbi:spore coat protein [Oceanobacillus sojae]|uniref:spore coat protein n=1 Tax=Oceanobacillus sojae TaxID=582851 RepID=UPI0009888A57|nr:spore coat protein [Oceanobacillus sojae]MCT1902819.1 spore coat protein [Oceanobacillus sojae]